MHCKKIFIQRAHCWDEEQRAPVGDDGEGPGAQWQGGDAGTLGAAHSVLLRTVKVHGEGGAGVDLMLLEKPCK
jgi:hypothetical protein